MVMLLAAYNVNLECLDKTNNNAIMYVCTSLGSKLKNPQRVPLLRYLLNKHAFNNSNNDSNDSNHDSSTYVYMTNAEGCTALYLASQSGLHDLVKELIKSGTDINCAVVGPPTHLASGATPLQIASQKGHIKVVKILLEAGPLWILQMQEESLP